MSGRILIVDDVATNRLILSAKLTKAYFDVVFAENRREALTKIHRQNPDLVLLNNRRSAADGLETCKRIRKDAQLANIPIIMIASHFSRDDRLAALRAGADDFFARPENDRVLLARVRNLMRSKRVLDDLALRGQALDDLGFEMRTQAGSSLRGNRPRITCHGAQSQERQQVVGDPNLQQRYTFADDTATTTADLFLIVADPIERSHNKRIARIRAELQTRNVPIILLLAQCNDRMIAEALDLGANDALVLPVNPAELALRIDHWLARKSREDMLREQLQTSLSEAALDPLTGLHNRRYFERHFARAIRNADQSGKGFALLMIDIDNFKRVNDAFGHATGDAILRQLAERLNANLRGVDLIARIGGEEFLVAMPATTRSEAMIAAERLRHLIADMPFSTVHPEQSLRITASIGLVCDKELRAPLTRLTDAADRAMYRSKSEGRNMVTLSSFAA